MLSTVSTRRRFGATLGSLLSAIGLASAASPTFAARPSPGKEVEKLGADGKPVNGSPFIMPIVRYQGLIYVAGQGAHDDRPPQQWDNRESHAQGHGQDQEPGGAGWRQHRRYPSTLGLPRQDR